MGIFTKELLEKEFNLKEAIINDDVDLIFGNSIELLEESYKYSGKNNMKIMIRNKEEDEIPHPFTMKFIPDNNRKGDKNFYHDGYYGLPISFDRETKEWEVFIGDSKKSKAKAKEIKNSLTRTEKRFIASVVNDIGDDIIDYWEVKNTNTQKGKSELNNIIKRIEDNYAK